MNGHVIFGENQTLYDVLGLKDIKNLTYKLLASRRRKQLALLHTDSNKKLEETDSIKEARELVEFAFDILSNARKRVIYADLLKFNPRMRGYSPNVIENIKRYIDNNINNNNNTQSKQTVNEEEFIKAALTVQMMMQDSRMFY
jgi:curved DNA-binding protein CbpA